MPKISLKNLSLHYQKPLLNDVNITFDDQKISLLTGPSGSGKSTLLKLLANQMTSAQLNKSGTIQFNDTNIDTIPPSKRSQWIAMLFQDPGHQFTMTTGRAEIQFALENINLAPNKIKQRIAWALEFSGIASLADQPVQQLSGGEQQKMALAVIIAMDSQIILLDEPFASVDQTSRKQLLNQLKVLKQHHHKTILIIDHDLSDYEQVVDQIFAIHEHSIQRLNSAQVKCKLAPFQVDYKIILNHIQQANPTVPIINLHHFQLSIAQRQLLKVAHFDFERSSISIIQGDNGVGKSTLFRALTKAIPFQGQIQFKSQSIQKIKLAHYLRHVAMVFQDPETQFVKMTVREEIELSKTQATHQRFSDQSIQEYLKQMNLADHLDQIVYTLSMGQQKKLQILTMLIMANDVLLMDEPFAGLDYQSLQTISQIIRSVQQKFHQTFIIITHQLVGIEPLIDHLIILKSQTLRRWGGAVK